METKTVNQTLSCLSLCFLLLLPVATTVTAQDYPGAQETPSGDASYGEGVTVEQATPIADILADPDAYADKTVRVEGLVTEVCKKKGCWMMVADGEGNLLRVKVQDDVIIFPQGENGRQAAAQGTIRIFDLSREDYEGWQRHVAEEQGLEFDPESLGDGPYRIVQLQGTGAVTRPGK